jgi:hypothetical protein
MPDALLKSRLLLHASHSVQLARPTMRLPTYVFHLAEEANWPSIEQHGLLPARSLLERAFPQHSDLHSQHRPKHTILPTGVHIRDQGPMPARALAACLVGMTPPQWYALINAHVFFWLEPDRLNRQRAACAARPQVVATVRTADLLAHFAEVAYVTPFNTGYALRKPARRSQATLVPYTTWLGSGWTSEAQSVGGTPRARTHPPAELLIRGPIFQFRRLVHSVVRLPPGASFEPRAA